MLLVRTLDLRLISLEYQAIRVDKRAAAPPLLPIFRSRLQGELLALALVDPSRQWTIDELARRTGEPYQTVAAEVRRLQEAELLVATTVGRTKLLSANEANVYLPPLAQLRSRRSVPRS